MDDQDFADLVAVMDGSASTADPVTPTQDVDALGLQETHSPDDAPEPEPDASVEVALPPEVPEAVAEPETAPEVVDVEERARQIAEELFAQQQAANKAAVEAKLLEYNRQLDAQNAQEFEKELQEYDAALADKYRQSRNFLSYDREQARAEAQRMEHGLNALTLAVEQRFEPAVMQEIVGEAQMLMGLPSQDDMIRYLNSKRSAVSQESARVQELQRQNRELQLKLDAQSRPLQADIVDGGQTGPGGSSFQERWDNATDMDDVMALLTG